MTIPNSSFLIPNCKQPFCVLGSDIDQLLRIHSPDLCDTFGGIGDVLRVVSLASERHGRKIRRVGLEQKPVERYRGGYLNGNARVLEGTSAA